MALTRVEGEGARPHRERPKRPNCILTPELAQQLNDGFGGEAEDCVPLAELRKWNGQHASSKKHYETPYPRWRDVMLRLTTPQKAAISNALRYLAYGEYSTVGLIRSTPVENLIKAEIIIDGVHYPIGKDQVEFLKASFERKEDHPQKVKSFKTSKGSVYTYDEDGKATRFKTATGKIDSRKDITVFVDLTSDEEQERVSTYLPVLDILEIEEGDKPPRSIRDISEVKDPSRIVLGVMNDGGSYKLFNSVSIKPVIGWTPFEYKLYKEEGRWERHLGNEVTEIEY